jgi:proteasome assembly chaperone (PAC2) family protein
LTALSIVIHATGIALMAFATARIRFRLEKQNFEARQVFAIVIGLVGAVGLLLAALHGIEAVLWAEAYLWFGALDSPADAILYSVDSISTRGASGLMLERRWRMMGALEAMDGMLLFGISTAYIFTVLQLYWPLMTHRPHD